MKTNVLLAVVLAATGVAIRPPQGARAKHQLTRRQRSLN